MTDLNRELVRTVGGLLEGVQKSVCPADFRDGVNFVERVTADEALKQALGLDTARLYARAPVLPANGWTAR